MNIVQLIISINKLSLLAFLATLGFLIYELYQFKRERKKQEKPAIPAFDYSSKKSVKPAPELVKTKPVTIKKPNKKIIIFIVAVLTISGLTTVLLSLTTKDQKLSDIYQTHVSQTASKGIVVFTEQFEPISDAKLKDLQPGDTMIIGIYTVPGSDIDSARIRVNQTDWDENNITTLFNEKHQVFYTKYMIASGTPELKIQAQLHSSSEGWLGD